MVARDQVRVDRQAQEPQAVVEVVLPHRRVPLEEVLGAPDVVDEHVEAALLGVDPRDQGRDLRGVEVVDRDRDPLATRRRHELGGLLDRLRPVDLGAPLARRAAGRVDGRARLAEADGDAASGAAGRPGDEGDAAFQWSLMPSASVRVADRGARPAPEHEHGGEHERAAGELDGPSVSPNTRNASSTVTRGSTVARIDAASGPTRRRPAKKRPIAATVETSARHGEPAPARRPSARPGATRRAAPSPAVSDTAAPVHTSADSTRGAHARGDALADEDVARCRRPPRASAERGAERVERARAGAGHDERERRPRRARARPRGGASIRSRPSATAATATIAGNV